MRGGAVGRPSPSGCNQGTRSTPAAPSTWTPAWITVTPRMTLLATILATLPTPPSPPTHLHASLNNSGPQDDLAGHDAGNQAQPHEQPHCVGSQVSGGILQEGGAGV